jgi:purine-binding chemotaxis protein CheW
MSTMSGLSLVFRADVHLCAIGLDEVVEVMRPLPVRPLAEGAVSFVEGVCVARGVAMPVVNVGCLISGRRRRPARLVSVRGGGRPVLLAVDEVLGIRDLPADSLQDLSSLGVVDADPLLFLRDARLVPDSVWREVRMERTLL